MEYGHANPKEFLEAMTKIERKMGGQHFNAAKEKLASGDMYATIDLLLNHYDRVYSNGLTNKQHRIVHKVQWDGVDAAPIVTELMSLRPTLSL